MTEIDSKKTAEILCHTGVCLADFVRAFGADEEVSKVLKSIPDALIANQLAVPAAISEWMEPLACGDTGAESWGIARASGVVEVHIEIRRHRSRFCLTSLQERKMRKEVKGILLDRESASLSRLFPVGNGGLQLVCNPKWHLDVAFHRDGDDLVIKGRMGAQIVWTRDWGKKSEPNVVFAANHDDPSIYQQFAGQIRNMVEGTVLIEREGHGFSLSLGKLGGITYLGLFNREVFEC